MPRKKKQGSTRTGHPIGRPPIVELNLKYGHHISGTSYGPGKVRVDVNVAATLNEQERNRDTFLADFFSPTGKAGIITQTGTGTNKLVPVSADYFDQALANSNPFTRVSGR